MRFDGTLKSWDAERGFGFIAPRTGGQDIFIHISAFPRDGRAPREGEALTFEVETSAEGKKRATRVQRPGSDAATAYVPGSRSPGRQRPERRGTSVGSGLVALALVAALGWYGYGKYQRQASARAQPVRDVVPAASEVQLASSFRCDGRTHCSQMTSCTEAKYFLKNCAGVQMDGNHDGIPCEQQWCTSPLAK